MFVEVQLVFLGFSRDVSRDIVTRLARLRWIDDAYTRFLTMGSNDKRTGMTKVW